MVLGRDCIICTAKALADAVSMEYLSHVDS
jgi:hypothetical protein